MKEQIRKSDWYPDKEFINEYFEMAKNALEKRFVGEPLTTIELGWLRRDLEATFKMNSQISDKGQAYTSADPAVEAVERFLEHYGIHRRDFPSLSGDRRMLNLDDEPARRYIQNYLRKAREESHKPFLD